MARGTPIVLQQPTAGATLAATTTLLPPKRSVATLTPLPTALATSTPTSTPSPTQAAYSFGEPFWTYRALLGQLPPTATPAIVRLDRPTSTTVPSPTPVTPTAVPPTALPQPTAVPTVAPATATPTPEPIVLAGPASDALATAHLRNNIGFHVGVGGNPTGIGEWMRSLDAAGVPFFIKSVDQAGILTEAQALIAQSGVPHTLVFRSTGNDVPNYALPPAQAAAEHWAWHRDRFPPELNRGVIWLETINEVDKGRSEWLAEFALATAKLAQADGFRWAAFGWSSGEPEPAQWSSPKMLEFLRYAADHPLQIGIALHEYSYLVGNIQDGYPHKIGRFQALHAICDQNGIRRPTILITEWGWEYQNVPEPGQAIRDIAWANSVYAPHPNIFGAGIWYLGGGYADIANQTQRLIKPLEAYILSGEGAE